MRFSKWILIAILFHFIFLIIISKKNSPFRKEERQDSYTEIDLRTEPLETGKEKSSKTNKISKNKNNLKKIVPATMQMGMPTGSSAGSIGEVEIKKEDIGYNFANSLGVEEEARLSSFIYAIWKKVNQNISYPDDFVKKRLQGKVTIQFNVNGKGQFTGKFISADSEQILLKVYASAILPHALRDPLPETMWTDRKEIPIIAHINFNTYGPTEVTPEVRPEFFKNIITIHRYASVDPWLNQEIEEIYTNYFPPIIPVPGGFFIDFIRAYHLVKNIGKPTVSEARNKRLEMLREEWESIIQRSE